MKQPLSLLFLVLLISTCARELTTRNIVLAEHLESLALIQAQQDCKDQSQDCDLSRTLATEIANLSVSKAIVYYSIDCEDPPCDWPDTIFMALIPELKENDFNSLASLKFFPCEDPPCDWPDTLKRNAQYDFVVGFTHLKDHQYEFEIVDPNNNNEVIASSKPAIANTGKQLKEGKLVRATFTVIKPDYSGDAQIIMRRIGLNPKDEQVFKIDSRIYNPSSN